jgi:hypothetical protein
VTPVLLALAALCGLVVGLRLKHRRYLLVREQLRDATQRISAWKTADHRTDLDVVGPVTPKPEFFDFEAAHIEVHEVETEPLHWRCRTPALTLDDGSLWCPTCKEFLSEPIALPVSDRPGRAGERRG